MPSPFDLRFILPVRPLPLDGALSGLVAYDAPAHMPVDSAGDWPPYFLKTFKAAERRRCDELKSLAARFESEDVIHFVVGFMPVDFEAAASTDVMRRHRVRQAVWKLLRSMLVQHGADSIDSLVAMHLESEFPHVHVAVSRYARAGVVLTRINSIPAALLPLN